MLNRNLQYRVDVAFLPTFISTLFTDGGFGRDSASIRSELIKTLTITKPCKKERTGRKGRVLLLAFSLLPTIIGLSKKLGTLLMVPPLVDLKL